MVSDFEENLMPAGRGEKVTQEVRQGSTLTDWRPPTPAESATESATPASSPQPHQTMLGQTKGSSDAELHDLQRPTGAYWIIYDLLQYY